MDRVKNTEPGNHQKQLEKAIVRILVYALKYEQPVTRSVPWNVVLQRPNDVRNSRSGTMTE
jgi:hypothetical protein